MKRRTRQQIVRLRGVRRTQRHTHRAAAIGKSVVYQALPASAHLLKKQMEDTLLTYEPRIRSIDIELNDVPDPELKVSYVMSCHLKKAGLVRFGTYLDPPGRMRVQRVERER
jgi:type VI secretion system protein